MAATKLSSHGKFLLTIAGTRGNEQLSRGGSGVRVVAGPSIVPSKCDELSSKGSFRLAANLLLRPATVTVHCSKNRKLSNYTQLPSPLQQLLQPAASVNEALPTYLHPPNYY